MARPLKICFAASEVHPYAKSGGLADVSGALPPALAAMGHDVRIFMPHYSRLIRSSVTAVPLQWRVPIAGVAYRGSLFETTHPGGVPVYFLGNDRFFGRDGLYGEGGHDYADNADRFIFFSRSVLEACKALNFKPDIIHCSDWQTGLIPAHLGHLYASDPFFGDTRTVFSIHNLGYQGNYSVETLHRAQLPGSMFHPGGVEFFGNFSFLKAALVYSDLLTTVSRTYGKEIQTPEHGFGMDGVLRWRSKDLHGIPNGIDQDEWDPQQDPHLARNYGPRSLGGKEHCKRDLAGDLGLKLGKREPLIGLVTRLSHQKGIELVAEGLETLLGSPAALALLGSGEPHYEDFFRDGVRRHPGQLACRIGFDEALAHRILAGCDLLLVPSRYEPCGLTQMYALRYGTVPVVRAVGGLRDTVQQFRPASGRGTGFLFRPFELKYFLKSVHQALSLYSKPESWRRLMLNGMARDNGWKKAARQYVQMYRKAMNSPRRFT